jgi:type IV pilus assembly protein PilQ
MRKVLFTSGGLVTCAWVLVALLAAGCGSAPGPSTAGQSAVGGASAPAAAVANEPRVAARLQEISVREGAPGMQVDLRTDQPVVWTSYRDGIGALVIELPDTLPADGLGNIPGEGLLAGIDVVAETTGERPLTRLTVHAREEFEYSLASENDMLRLRVVPPADSTGTTAAPSAPVPVEAAEPIRATPEDAPSATLPFSADQSLLAADQVFRGPAVSGSSATRLERLEAIGPDAFVLRGDGEFAYSYLRLVDPDRFVVDLEGAVQAEGRSVVPTGPGRVRRIRMAQFRSHPDLVTRVVFDLEGPTATAITSDPAGLVVRFGQAGAGEEPEQIASRGEAPRAGVEAAESADVGEASPSPAGQAAVATASVSAGQTREAPQVAAARQDSAAPVAPAPAPREPPVAAVPVVAPVAPFAGQTVGGTARVYTGEPVSFSVRDADVREVLRTIAGISGLNMVVQPDVAGSVTVELNDVPWDQALDQILKINKLGMELDGNILRIAKVQQLREEAEEQQRLRAAQALSVPLQTVIKRLSYSTAAEVAGILQSRAGSGVGGNLMSQRGSIIIDGRTNTLIIKELPEYMNTVIAVIDNLDIPEPQVMIEARIVETTKQFSRSLGVAWDFGAVADAAHGNTTGLVFPNNARGTGGANLLTGGRNGFLDVSLGNILNTFTLDATLQAAESEGLINILSTPKVATLNNQRAEIQSGLQIPIQTVANNTVTVQFVNATLRLSVTPHVTAEGTVLLDIDVQKREPLEAFLVVGAGNAPISTKEARTRVIVRDGGTTVIGGIYKVSQNEGQDRVPGLANVPLLGHLFKNRRRSDQNEELLIFITPRVIKL